MVATLFCTLIILLLVIFSWIYTRKSFDRYLESFIELNQDITVITSQTEILAMNRAGLVFFGFKNLNILLKKTRYLSKLFSEVISEDNRLIEGINWVTKIPEGENVKVQISSGTFTQTFHMQVSSIKTNRYMVTFHNISRVIAEKNTISELAEKDELTQIYNRAKIKSLLSLALRDAEIHHIPFSIIMIDIDHFKKVNDSYGHDTGDKVLIEVTSLLRSLLRSQDEIGRWGGEEFIILSKSTTADEAYMIAEQLRIAIETFSFYTSDTLTCSFGISEYLPNDTLANIIKKSDEALYRAKKAGRNTVCR
jgi:diguanylate cyclase (GGDEF)-like protein